MAAGALYAWIPGVLKVKKKVNEVITTIMMNSIAIYFCAFLSNGPWKTSQPNRVSGGPASYSIEITGIGLRAQRKIKTIDQ